MNTVIPAKRLIGHLGFALFCLALLVLGAPAAPKAEVPASSKVRDVVDRAAPAFADLLKAVETALGRKPLFSDSFIAGKIWLLRSEFGALRNRTVGGLTAEQRTRLEAVARNLRRIKPGAGAPAITADRATAMLRAAVDSALMGGDDTSVPTVAPRAVKPAYPGGRFRLRVSGIRPDDASVSLLLGGEVLAPARKVAEAFEFEVVRAGLPRAAGGIAFAPATLIIEEGLSVRERLEKLFAPNNPNRFERLIGTDVKRRAVPIVLTLLPDRIGLARLYGTRMSLKRTAVRDLKKDVRTLTSVSESREALICVTADSGCEIDRASVRYRITGWNAYYETEYCDTVCDQPLPFSRPRGNPQGMCPRVRVPGGFKAPQTQSCLEKRFEVDKGQWTAEKACVALVARPLLRGVRALAAAEIGGQQRCLAPHQERVLVTKDPFSIGWSAARRVRLSKAYEGLTVAFAAADGNTHAMIPEGEDAGPLRLRWSAKDRVATIRANTRFWWD